ncbi:MAG TPA: peptidoglycan DD-metalloendopeptidase family protein [Atribacteraceae bacterium]|nr:peptidoglycan DD-metalloendopeptidase family protein [Atribacteraceae bacterium]
MPRKESKQFTVFWIHPLKGQLKKLHLSWKTILLSFILLVLGIGFGVGGVFWYRGRIKNELVVTARQLDVLKRELFTLDTRKQEQEEKLAELTLKAEEALREIGSLRELDQKVREILEKDLQSGLQKLGVDISLSGSASEMYIPLDRFTRLQTINAHFGQGGPSFSLATLPTNHLPARLGHDQAFQRRVETLENTLAWIRAETMVREKSFREIVDVAQKREQLVSIVPLRWPTWGRIASNYGWRNDPFTGRRAWHTGVDIAAPTGRNVVSTADGKVVFAGWNGNYGRTVIVRHQFGFETLYAHLSNIRVRTGDNVAKNQIIGNVGSTGRSTGPHLHYEVRRHGNILNPWPYLP